MSEDRLKLPKTDKSPAVLPEQFQPMSTSLNLPLFEPKAITPKNVGTAAGFDLSPTNPAKVFGLPKKMFLEVRSLAGRVLLYSSFGLTILLFAVPNSLDTVLRHPRCDS